MINLPRMSFKSNCSHYTLASEPLLMYSQVHCKPLPLDMQRYYIDRIADLVNRLDKTFVFSCVPTLALEISQGCLRVSGLAVIRNKLLCEPLTPQLHLFCSNSQEHMLHLARVLQAMYNALPRLAALRTNAATCALTTQSYSQALSVQWPWLILQRFPGAEVSQPWGLRRPIYFVKTQEKELLVVKFQQSCEGVEVQKAWHQNGLAPEVVSEETSG